MYRPAFPGVLESVGSYASCVLQTTDCEYVSTLCSSIVGTNNIQMVQWRAECDLSAVQGVLWAEQSLKIFKFSCSFLGKIVSNVKSWNVNAKESSLKGRIRREEIKEIYSSSGSPAWGETVGGALRIQRADWSCMGRGRIWCTEPCIWFPALENWHGSTYAAIPALGR